MFSIDWTLKSLVKRYERTNVSSKEGQVPRAGFEPATKGDITRKTHFSTLAPLVTH